MQRRTALLGLLAYPLLCAANGRRFVVFDNMFYRGKPVTAADGLVLSNILYEGVIWPHDAGFGVAPPRAAFASLVAAHARNPGPLVLDIERLPLSGDAARRNLDVLATLAEWAREAAPGKAVGYYGTNTLTRVPPASLELARTLARHVDALFPPMYTFDDDRAAWARRADNEAAEARALAPGRPVYFYLWPQYHDGTPRQFQFLDADTWAFQLRTALRVADGIVLWSPGRFDWTDATGWWAATQRFVRELR
jgi:hypothetical protein